MTVTFTGDKTEPVERVQTKSWSFNRALRDVKGSVGFPVRSLVELYGPKGVGKTSFSLDIIGTVAVARNKGVSILDLEGQYDETVATILENTGYDGEVYFVRMKGDERPEDTAERFCDRMFDFHNKKPYENPDVGLMDSIGAYRPSAEFEGKIGDANMGVKPREIGQISARYIRSLDLSKNPGTIFMTNHEHPNMSIGFGNPAPITSGGETKKYLSQIRIRLTDCYYNKASTKFDGSWLIEGKVHENRFGISDQKFYAFMIGGEGIHAGLTSMFECLIYKHATSSAEKSGLKDTTTISLDGKSYGKIGRIIRDRYTDPEIFNPFLNRLKAETIEIEDDTESMEETPKKGRKK